LALKLTGEVGDGYILQLGDPEIASWMIKAVRDSAEAAGRDPDAIAFCVAAPAYVGDGDSATERAHMRDQCRWFGGMVGNHVADIVRRYGTDSGIPRALTDYIKAREGYDYNQHGRAGNTHTAFVSDEIVERFCLLGSPSEHVEKLQELRKLGCTQFATYLQHDNKEATLRTYGEQVIPAVNETAAAVT
jgi:probable F420-dependent oxidoreductase